MHNIRKFYDFMQANGAWEKLKRNCRNEDLNGDTHIFSMADPRNYVAGGFWWIPSPEGLPYWGDLEDLWWEALNE